MSIKKQLEEVHGRIMATDKPKDLKNLLPFELLPLIEENDVLNKFYAEHLEPETYNIEFEPALHRVMEFIKDPLLMWQTGDLAQKRLVLRIVFDEPLVFDANTGFYTASLSLPVAISCTTGENLKYVVEMPGIEPGSNVQSGYPYGHGSSVALPP